jgi:uncharacterized protein (TIGR01615 family)
LPHPLCCLSTQLAQAVQEAKASSILSTGSADLRVIGSYLRSKYGYLVYLRQANISKRPKAYLRQLRHDFLVIRGLPSNEGLDVLVDLNFRDHFRVAHATPWYSKLLAALPQDWVGSAAGLAPLVGLMSAGIRLCFRQAGIPLPPWREGRAMLSKWVTELQSDEQLPMIPLPDAELRRLLGPYHRSASRQASSSKRHSSGTAQHNAARSGQQQHGKQATAQAAGVVMRPAALPPLPPSAAAAGAARPAQQQQEAGADGSRPHHHHHVVPDVPRRIITGFPIATAPSAAFLQQQLAARDQDTAVGAHDTLSSSISGFSAWPRQHEMQQQQQQADQANLSAASPAASTQQTQMAGEGPAARPGTLPPGTAAAGRCAGAAQFEPGGSHSTNASSSTPAAAAAAAGGSTARAPSAGVRARPAFTTTAGVVVATAGGTSPGIVVDKLWVQQLTQGALHASCGDKGKAATAEPGGVDSSTGGSRDGCPGSAAPVAPATAAAVRQFKSLDQLLPRMRTVKLGAA